MFSPSVRNHRRAVKIGALLLAVVLLGMQTMRMNGQGVVMDDAFISFRYARNLSNGVGLVFNEGERVEGYTNFLWVVLLALSHRLGLNMICATKLWAFLSALITLVIIVLMGDELFGDEGAPWPVAMSLMLFSGQPSQARYVVSGMETLLFTSLLTGALYLFVRERYLSSSVVFVLTAMARPEGVMYFSLTLGFGVLVGCLFDPGRLSRRDMAIFFMAFSLMYGLYFLWRYQYFGHLLPNTFYAKASGVHLARLRRGWRLLLEVLGQWRVFPLLLLGLFSVASRSDKHAWLLFAGLVLATCAYFVWVGGDFIVWFGPRFLMPVFPLMLLLGGQGVRNVSEFICADNQARKYAFQIALTVLLFINGFGFGWASGFSAGGPFSVQMRGWIHLAHWISNHTAPDSTIATDAAGIIPYYSNRYSIDMFGLTDEHVAHLEVPVTEKSTVGHEKYDPSYILERKPDYIVSTWLDAQGHAVAAGLGAVREQVEQSYKLVAVAKVREGAPADGRWVLETSSYDEALHDAGYRSGVFERVDSQ